MSTLTGPYSVICILGVIGVIDGSHFTIKAPVEQQDCYTDRKLNKSIIMQGNLKNE